MTTTRVVLLAALASVLFASPSAAHVDGMTLRATRGSSPDDVKLDWTGGQPLFQVYRSTLPRDVVSPENLIGESQVRTWLDVPPSAAIWFYQVGSACAYNPPEVCDGLDNDCDGTVDEPGAEQSCDDLAGCTVDTCVGGACQHVDRSLCVAAPETDPDACGTNGCDVCSFAATEAGCDPPDSDGDGFKDVWEDAGWIDIDCNGVLDSSDATLPDSHKHVKDIYLKLSSMTNAPYEPDPMQHIPTPEAIEHIVAAFAASHLTTPPVPCDGSPGGSCPPGLVCSIADHVCLPFCQTDSQCVTGRCVGGACRERRLHVDPVIHPVPHAEVLFFGPVQPACITGGDPARGVNFYDLKLDPANFDPKTALFKHYGVFGHFNSCDSPATCGDPACVVPLGTATQGNTSGLAEVKGNDFVVSLGEELYASPDEKAVHEAGVLMHELGHNLGLRHGGPDCDPPNDPSCLNAPTQDRKVNHLSVMNHMYASGIPFAPMPGSTIPSGTRLDYSRYVLPRLYEPCLDELGGLSPGSPPGFENDLVQYICARGPLMLVRYGSLAPGQPIDWNCDGTLDTCVQANINDWPPGAPADETHAAMEEWSGLKYRFQCGTYFEDGP